MEGEAFGDGLEGFIPDGVPAQSFGISFGSPSAGYGPPAAPVKRKPGRPRKVEGEAATVAGALAHLVPETIGATAPVAPDWPQTREAVIAWFDKRLAKLDFRQFGTQARILVVIVRDTSPSEEAFEHQWVAGAAHMAGEVSKVLAARNTVDVALINGDDDARLVAFDHAKDFAFPTATSYGISTDARPWLAAVRALVDHYTAHLCGLSLQCRDVVLVVCSDFQFGGHTQDLKDFKSWAGKACKLTLVPVHFGELNAGVVQGFVEGIPPVDLTTVPLADFFRALSQSVVSASGNRYKSDAVKGSLARSMSRLPSSGGLIPWRRDCPSGRSPETTSCGCWTQASRAGSRRSSTSKVSRGRSPPCPSPGRMWTSTSPRSRRSSALGLGHPAVAFPVEVLRSPRDRSHPGRLGL